MTRQGPDQAGGFCKIKSLVGWMGEAGTRVGCRTGDPVYESLVGQDVRGLSEVSWRTEQGPGDRRQKHGAKSMGWVPTWP